MEGRDDAALAHTRSRAAQPKLLVAAPIASSLAHGPPSTNIYLQFDQGFGSVSDQIEGTRFNYIGTSPQISMYEKMRANRTSMNPASYTFGTWQQ